jgi:hypothetical protein
METIVVQSDTPEKSKAIKAILKALDVKFFASKSDIKQSKKIAKGVGSDYKEALEAEVGKKEVKSYASFQELIDDV